MDTVNVQRSLVAEQGDGADRAGNALRKGARRNTWQSPRGP
jgi:hypothetical protein